LYQSYIGLLRIWQRYPSTLLAHHLVGNSWVLSPQSWLNS
jgi:hypothetical protein